MKGRPGIGVRVRVRQHARIGPSHDLVQALGGPEARGAGANDENVDVAG